MRLQEAFRTSLDSLRIFQNEAACWRTNSSEFLRIPEIPRSVFARPFRFHDLTCDGSTKAKQRFLATPPSSQNHQQQIFTLRRNSANFCKYCAIEVELTEEKRLFQS